MTMRPSPLGPLRNHSLYYIEPELSNSAARAAKQPGTALSPAPSTSPGGFFQA
jgi:hypothetical protein